MCLAQGHNAVRVGVGWDGVGRVAVVHAIIFFFIFCYYSMVMLSKFYLANLRPTAKSETTLQPNKTLNENKYH